MSCVSDKLKQEYKKETEKTRTKNLKKIREEVSGLSLSEFAKITGMTKNDVSCYESGSKTLSLFATLAYKKYFFEYHNINLSSDFLMGFTDIMENDGMDFQKKIGLSDKSMEIIKRLRETKEVAYLDILNILIEDENKFRELLNVISVLLHPEILRSEKAFKRIDNASLCQTYALLQLKEVINGYKK